MGFPQAKGRVVKGLVQPVKELPERPETTFCVRFPPSQMRGQDGAFLDSFFCTLVHICIMCSLAFDDWFLRSIYGFSDLSRSTEV